MKILLQSFCVEAWEGMYNLALPYLHAALVSQPDIAEAVNVRLIQSDFFTDVEEVFREIRDFEPDVVGLSVFVWSVELTERLVRRFDELPKRPTVVCGGKGLFTRERAFLDANPGVDVVAKGAGEATFVELARHWLRSPSRPRDLAAVAGLAYRDDDGIHETEARTVNLPLSALPSPYLTGLFEPHGVKFSFETERSCPYRCAYCTWSFDRRRRDELQFPLDVVRQELRWTEPRGYQEIQFFDSAVNYDPERFQAILDAVAANPWPAGDVNYFFFVHHDFIRAEQLRALARTRQQFLVYLGVETLSEPALRLANRPNRLARVVPLLDALSRVKNIRLMVSLILGLPGDDANSFLRSVDFLLRYPELNVMVCILSVGPGTRLRGDGDAHGLVYPSRGVPLVTASNSFPRPEFERALDRIESLIPTGRVSLNPINVPLSRLENPGILPAAVRARLGPDSRVRVGAAGLGPGTVVGSGFYGEAPPILQRKPRHRG